MTRLNAMEKRLEALERKVKSLDCDRTHWLDRVVGSMADFPDFDKVIEYGRQFRRDYDRIVAADRRKSRRKPARSKR